MVKTTEEIGYRYLEVASEMEDVIKNCSRELKEAAAKGDYKRYMYLKRKRLVLYGERRELLETGYKLIHYYERKD